MQTRDEFVAKRQRQWLELEQLVSTGAQLHTKSPTQIAHGAALYRAVCSDLMHARAMGFGYDLADHLNALASRAHNALYGPPSFSFGAVVHFLRAGFAQTLRRNLSFFLIASAMFYLPLGFAIAATLTDTRFALNVLPPSTLEAMASAYSSGFGDGREAGADSAMAGFYVYNNIGIAFRCFATGILFGLGSLFFLIYNGVATGAVLGYVITAGAGRNILTFICGHGPFELTAIVISGAAGLKMGYALVKTNQHTRLGSLRSQAGELVELISGAAVMLLIAAIVEGFWSPSGLPDQVKWAFSGIVSLCLCAYFAFAGRGTVHRSLRPPSHSLSPPPPSTSTPSTSPSSIPPQSTRGIG